MAGSIPRQTAAQGATRPNNTRTTPEGLRSDIFALIRMALRLDPSADCAEGPTTDDRPTDQRQEADGRAGDGRHPPGGGRQPRKGQARRQEGEAPGAPGASGHRQGGRPLENAGPWRGRGGERTTDPTTTIKSRVAK